jgi:glycine cleavage system H protein
VKFGDNGRLNAATLDEEKKAMIRIPKELKYTQTHEWLRLEDDGTYVIGITEHAQSQLGELVFVDLPDVGTRVHSSDEVCVVESVKTASDVYSPLSGLIIAVNEDLEESPSLVNSDPYHDGWLYRIQPSDEEELTELLDSDAYSDSLEEADEE